MAIKYIDLNEDFPADLDNACCTNLTAIRKNLTRLFTTKIGTVPFNRTYGSSLYNLLFENTAELSLYQIELLIFQDITDWEPRVNIGPEGISITQNDEHSYNISVTFTVPGINEVVATMSQNITE